jgi:hypothetical protein
MIAGKKKKISTKTLELHKVKLNSSKMYIIKKKFACKKKDFLSQFVFKPTDHRRHLEK